MLYDEMDEMDIRDSFVPSRSSLMQFSMAAANSAGFSILCLPDPIMSNPPALRYSSISLSSTMQYSPLYIP